MTDTPGPPAGPPPAAPPPPSAAGGGAASATAGLGARFGARLLDALIVGIPVSIVFAIFGIGMGGFGISSWLSNAVFSLLWFGYYVYFESSTGATLGKKLLNLRVTDAAGGTPTMETTAKRNVWMLFGLIPFVGGLISFVVVIIIAVTINSDPNNRGKHDEFAGTGVLR